MAPLYLSHLFCYKKTRYALRCEITLSLAVPKYQSMFGECALAVQGAIKLWNNLPLLVKLTGPLKHYRPC